MGQGIHRVDTAQRRETESGREDQRAPGTEFDALRQEWNQQSPDSQERRKESSRNVVSESESDRKASQEQSHEFYQEFLTEKGMKRIYEDNKRIYEDNKRILKDNKKLDVAKDLYDKAGIRQKDRPENLRENAAERAQRLLRNEFRKKGEGHPDFSRQSLAESSSPLDAARNVVSESDRKAWQKQSHEFYQEFLAEKGLNGFYEDNKRIIEENKGIDTEKGLYDKEGIKQKDRPENLRENLVERAQRLLRNEFRKKGEGHLDFSRQSLAEISSELDAARNVVSELDAARNVVSESDRKAWPKQFPEFYQEILAKKGINNEITKENTIATGKRINIEDIQRSNVLREQSLSTKGEVVEQAKRLLRKAWYEFYQEFLAEKGLNGIYKDNKKILKDNKKLDVAKDLYDKAGISQEDRPENLQENFAEQGQRLKRNEFRKKGEGHPDFSHYSLAATSLQLDTENLVVENKRSSRMARKALETIAGLETIEEEDNNSGNRNKEKLINKNPFINKLQEIYEQAGISGISEEE